MFEVNLGKSRLAYSSMSVTKSRLVQWETQAEIDACLLANDVSPTQLARWRREFKLFPEVEQVSRQYRGSETRYPLGTCAQIAAAARLFKIRNRAEYVGRQLWWEGFPVDEKYWRPRLEKSARLFDRTVSRILRFQSSDGDTGMTLQERMARTRRTNIVLSRIRGRLSAQSQSLSAHFGVLLSVATGDFTGFALRGPNETKAFDQTATIVALDIGNSESDVVLSQKLRFTTVLPIVLQAMASAFESHTFLDVALGPEQVISSARDDVRNALRIAVAMYEATAWIYGKKAFGLRLAAWIAKKKPPLLVDMMILGFTMVRRKSNQFYSSAEIADLAHKAEQARCDSLRIRELGRSDPRFAKVFLPKRVRQGLRDMPSYNNWIKEIGAVRISPNPGRTIKMN